LTTAGITRKPAFWIVYALAAALALLVGWRLFPLAIPLLNLDIRLARGDAIAQAEALARTHKLGPDNPRTAARFEHDQTAQNYVELEGGGKEAFAALVAGDLYAPFWWEVRLFRPGEPTEATIRFRPDGTRDGFVEKLPEKFVPADPAGLALTESAARSVAEERARVDWGVDLGAYRLLEHTQQTRTTGRVDHAFVYQRTSGNIADSRFRLRLAVTGDMLTEVTPYVHVPESFERRYTELRSANNTIANSATLAAGILYGIGGCIFGTLWLLRTRSLQWRPAVAAGFVVGSLVGAALLANAPTAWFDFDTAQTATTFWVRQVGRAALALFAGGLAYSLVFMTAEGLSRRAFGGHPQLWRLWSREAAPTRAVVGRTLGGYLFVPIGLAFVAAFYYATNRWLGWWQPSESLTDPNILGSALPALTPIALSLQAGFMEECLFRAIPLSLAALIGARFGHRRLAIGIAVVVQAVVFGAAHANYPGFPAYSRLVELIVPAAVWALIFLRFGLLPTILLHALFDLSLMSIPVFLVDAPGSDAQRALVILAGFVPLAMVIARSARAGALRELPERLRNAAWQPALAAAAGPVYEPAAMPAHGGWPAQFQRALPLLGVGGLVVWMLTAPLHADAPSLPLSRSQAEAVANAALAARGIRLGTEWHRSATIRTAPEEPGIWMGHKFVWDEKGATGYRKLIGNIFAPPLWDVRYARFEGSVAERAEEWHVTVDGKGAVRQVRHVLPEDAPGARLSRDDALALAERTVRDQWDLDPAALKLIGTEQKVQPERTDWTFKFADPRVDVGPDGIAALIVVVAGDQVAGYGRFVEVPEAWQRGERERDQSFLVARMVFVGLLGVAGLAAIVMAIVDWTHGRRDRRALWGVAGIVLALGLVTVANNWPQIAYGLNTDEPIVSQLAIKMVALAAGALVSALLFGLMAGVGAWAAAARVPHPLASRVPGWALAVAAALFAAGVRAALDRITPPSVPLWPVYGVESLALPALGAAVEGARLLAAIGVGIFLLHWLAQLTGGWTRRAWLVAGLLIVIAVAASLGGAQDPRIALVEGLATGGVAVAVVYGLLRFDYALVPAYMATGAALGFVENALRKDDPHALVYAAIAIVVSALVAWALTRYVVRARSAAPAAARSDPVATPT
jgi:hypothetical protein